MEVTKREKIMFAVLIIFIVIYGYYKFVFSKQIASIAALTSKRNEYEQKLTTLKLQVNSLEEKQSDIKITNSKIQEKTSRLYPYIQQERILLELDEIMNASKVKGSINLSAVSIEAIEKAAETNKTKASANPLAEVIKQYEALNKGSSDKKTPDLNSSDSSNKSSEGTGTALAEHLKVSVTFKGSYNDMLNFIKNIEAHNKKMLISNLSISKVTSGEINGSVDIEIFGVPKITNEDENYDSWSHNNAYGSKDPFSGGGIITNGTTTVPSLSMDGTINTTIEQSNIPKEDNYDFAMAVRAFNSDIPSIILGKAKDEQRKTYLYMDSSKEETVEIYFTEEEGKYYYKYKLGNNSFPEVFDGNGEVFVPSSNSISLKIFSNKRLSSEDLSGANVKVFNKTDKQVYVKVQDDDTNRPRVDITGNGGNVQVNR